MLAPIFGHISDALGDRFLGIANADRFPLQTNAATARRSNTKQNTRQLRAPSADETCHANNFSRPHRERYIGDAARGTTHVLHFQNHLARCAFGWWINGTHLTADHQLNHLRLRQAAHGMSAYAFAIAQNSHTVRQSENFFQAMRNVDHAHARITQIAHHRIKQMLLLLRQRGRRLIHDHDACSGAQCAGDFHQLLLRHREACHLGIW